jgi:hypothetical protein
MNLSLKSKDLLTWGIAPLFEPIVDEKIKEISANLPKEQLDRIYANTKIKKILDSLEPFKDSFSIVWDYLLWIKHFYNGSYLDTINNYRFSWFNFILVLYLFWDDKVWELLTLDWLKVTREDIFLWELLWALKIDADNQVDVLFKLQDFINQIYKGWTSDFNVTDKNWKTFLEFLLSNYSYYLQFWESISNWNLVSNIIYDFLWNLIDNNKLNFDKTNILKYIDELSIWLTSVNFHKWMYMLKRLFEDYEVKDEKIENKLVISSKVSYALSKYGEQLRMAISK